MEFCGIWMHDAEKSTIRNNRIEDCGLPHKESCSGGLQIGHMTDSSVHHNTIRENRGAYGIKTCIPEWTERNDPWSAPKVKLTRVHFHNNDIKTRQQGGWGQGQPNMSIELWHSEPDTCEIYQNRINTCVSLVEGGKAAKTIRVHHNLFILDPGYNYAIEAGHHNMEIDHNVFRNGIYPIATWGGPPDNLNVHNNVFDSIEDIALLAFIGATNFRFVNNIVTVKKDIPMLSLGKHGKESHGILIADNLFVKQDGPPQAAEMVTAEAANKPAPGSITIRGNHFWNWNPAGADSQSADPKLIREPDGDQLLKLAPDSPALKAGKGTPGGKLPGFPNDLPDPSHCSHETHALPPLFLLLTTLASAESPQQRSIAGLKAARELIAQQRHDDALKALQSIAAEESFPKLHRDEAIALTLEVARLKKGLPARDPEATRVRVSPAPKPGRTLYVLHGADDGDGSKEKPFSTLESALQAAADNKPSGGTEILLAPGRYPVTKGIQLDAALAGTADAPLVIRSVQPGKAVLFGGVSLKGFQPVTDPAILKRLPEEARGKVRQCDLKSLGITEYGKLAVRGFGVSNMPSPPTLELFSNGKPQTLARWPNEGFVKAAGVVEPGNKAAGKPSVMSYVRGPASPLDQRQGRLAFRLLPLPLGRWHAADRECRSRRQDDHHRRGLHYDRRHGCRTGNPLLCLQFDRRTRPPRRVVSRPPKRNPLLVSRPKSGHHPSRAFHARRHDAFRRWHPTRPPRRTRLRLRALERNRVPQLREHPHRRLHRPPHGGKRHHHRRRLPQPTRRL